MFNKILFHHDRDGKTLEKPVELTLWAVNAKYFTLSTSSYRCFASSAQRGIIEMPAMQISRSYGKLEDDPYNEDGKPPCTLFTIANPHVYYLGGSIEIIGWEVPNLSWAGIPRLPYDMCDEKKLKGQAYLPKQVQDKIHRLYFDELRQQRIVLVPKWEPEE